jgi:hypothetical protein
MIPLTSMVFNKIESNFNFCISIKIDSGFNGAVSIIFVPAIRSTNRLSRFAIANSTSTGQIMAVLFLIEACLRHFAR